MAEILAKKYNFYCIKNIFKIYQQASIAQW